MRRKIVLFFIITICFLLQTTVFQAITFANIAPNLLIIVVSAFGLMRGKKEGLIIGFFLRTAYRHIFWFLSRCVCFTLYVHRLYQRNVSETILSGRIASSDGYDRGERSYI